MRKPKNQAEFEPVNDLRKKELLEFISNNPKMVFQDITRVFPKTAFAQESGLHTTAFPAKMDKPEIIRVEEILKIAAYLGLEPGDLFAMIVRSIKPPKQAKKAASRKKKPG